MSDTVMRRPTRRKLEPYFDMSEGEDWRPVPTPSRRKVLFVARGDRRFENESGIAIDYIRADRRHFHDTVGVVTQRPADLAMSAPDPRKVVQGQPHSVLYTTFAYAVFALIVGGIVATAIDPNGLTEMGVPLGFTLWAVLAYLLRRSDRYRVHA